MAIRRNQPNVQAKDLPVSGVVTNSASFKPGENRAITGASVCGSISTAIASAIKPAATLSPASKRYLKNPRCGMSSVYRLAARGDDAADFAEESGDADD